MDIKTIRTRIQTEFIPSRDIISAREAKEIVKDAKQTDDAPEVLSALRKEFEHKFSGPGLREFDKQSARVGVSGASAILGGLQTQGMPGVKVETPDATTTRITVDFETAAASARLGKKFKGDWQRNSTEHCFELWAGHGLRVSLSEIGLDKVPTDPNLPRFTATAVGDEGASVVVQNNGWRTVSEGHGHILRAGTNTLHLHKNHNSDTPFMTLEIVFDKVNDWNYPQRPSTSPESRAFKKSWNRFWNPFNDTEDMPGFVLEGTARKKLDKKTADQMRQLKGPAELIKLWEKNNGALEGQYDFDNRYDFVFDPKSNSYAMGEYTSGESDHRLYIFNQQGEFAGYYSVWDDGSREWHEAFAGELGKPEAPTD